MAADFLLELLSQEIPARMQEKACADLQRLFADEIAKAGLAASGYTSYATPRRLALIARDLPLTTQAVSEEIKGPRASAPPQALEGFLRKTGLQKDNLVERDGVYFAIIDKPGRTTADVLAEAIPAIVRAFPWPKSMRWGVASQEMTSLRWVRPLQSIVALLGEDVIPFEIAGLRAGAATVGHRFHHPGQITIGSAADYADKLRMCHVIVDPAERQALIRDRAAALAAEAGLSVVPDEGLIAENAGLTEWPVPLLGHFDRAFLEVPPEVITLTMRTNQKYFALRDGEGRLAPNFICTANIDAADGGTAIAAGNARVLAARLSDAKFFWEQDLKIPLEEQAKKLGQIVFHEKLGTVADKVERVAKLARWLVEEQIVKPLPFRGGVGVGPLDGSPAARPHPPTPSPEGEGEVARLASLAEQAARLCKADLVTGMVGEFPELQGVIGGYYARAQALDPQVVDAIRDHYKPVGQGDEVPTAPVTVAVSLADKLDTLAALFSAGEVPSGSRDPYALRRSAIGVLSLINRSQLRLLFGQAVIQALTLVWMTKERLAFSEPGAVGDALVKVYGYNLNWQKIEDALDPANEWRKKLWRRLDIENDKSFEQLVPFAIDRLKVQQREAGVRHDLIDAVFALGGEDDLVRLLARVKALQAFIGSEDGANLLVGYRRAANILKKEGYSPSPLRREEHEGSESPRLSEGHAGSMTDPRVGEGGEAQPSAPAIESAEPLSQPSPRGGEGFEALSYTPEKEEAALIAALDVAAPAAQAAVAAEDFEGAMAALSSLRAPIDAFFDTVTVNDADHARRAARLDLLARIRDAVHAVADFSKISDI